MASSASLPDPRPPPASEDPIGPDWDGDVNGDLSVPLGGPCSRGQDHDAVVVADWARAELAEDLKEWNALLLARLTGPDRDELVDRLSKHPALVRALQDGAGDPST